MCCGLVEFRICLLANGRVDAVDLFPIAGKIREIIYFLYFGRLGVC